MFVRFFEGLPATTLTASVLALCLSACAQTSRVSSDVAPSALKSANKAVAVVRVGAASPTCINVGLLFGTREGEGYRRGKAVDVINVNSILEPAVAEIELDPGEHHIIGYACGKAKSVAVITAKTDHQIYATSYASFKLAAGEIVNIGYLQFNVSHTGRNALGRALDIRVGVVDWPLAELERYKQKRPEIFAKMTTRLMTISDRGQPAPTGDECAQLKSLRDAGKVQTLPASCA
jgi:hypothetical protein